MPSVEIHVETLPNGLTLLAEPMDGVRSLAMTLLLPAGPAHEPGEALGTCAILGDWVCRGAGDLNSREHVEALDQLGVQRSTDAGGEHLVISATMPSDRAEAALPLLLDMATRPRFEPDEFAPSQDLCLQALAGLEDEPQERVMLALRSSHFPEPFGRSSYGRAEHIEALTAERVRSFASERFVPGGAILSFAGQLDWPELRDCVARLTETWNGGVDEPGVQTPPTRGYSHHAAETEQVHIAVAYDAPREAEPGTEMQRLATAALSGGMSGRLFTEVREKRGLCYAVSARYGPGKRFGAVTGYAGTTTARAQETLDVFVGELRRLARGIDASEYERAMVGLKSRLVMQGESSGARAGAIARDQHVLGRPRTLDERLAAIEAVTLDHVNDYLAGCTVDDPTIVTIGSAALTPPTVQGVEPSAATT